MQYIVKVLLSTFHGIGNNRKRKALKLTFNNGTSMEQLRQVKENILQINNKLAFILHYINKLIYYTKG